MFLDIKSIAQVEQTCKSFRQSTKDGYWEAQAEIMPHLPPVTGAQGDTHTECCRRRPSREPPARRKIQRSNAAPASLPYVLSAKTRVRIYFEAKKKAERSILTSPTCHTKLTDVLFPSRLSRRSKGCYLFVHLSGSCRSQGAHAYRRRTIFEGFLYAESSDGEACEMQLRNKISWDAFDVIRNRMTIHRENLLREAEADGDENKVVTEQQIDEEMKRTFLTKLAWLYQFRLMVVAFHIPNGRMVWEDCLVFANSSTATYEDVSSERCWKFGFPSPTQNGTSIVTWDASLHLTDDYSDFDRIRFNLSQWKAPGAEVPIRSRIPGP